jgi:hypothetical protein
MADTIVRYLGNTPDSRRIEAPVYDELLKLYKAFHLLQADLKSLQESQPIPNPAQYQVVINGIGVNDQGAPVYATPS